MHVFKNVGTHLKKEGGVEYHDVQEVEIINGRRIKKGDNKESKKWQEFMKTFSLLLQAGYEEIYEERRQKLHQLNNKVADYVDDQYFDLWKHELVAYLLVNTLYFGIIATSIVESSHRQMKSWLSTFSADIYTCFEALKLLWEQGHRLYEKALADQAGRTPHYLRDTFWSAVVRIITMHGLHLAHRQWEIKGR